MYNNKLKNEIINLSEQTRKIGINLNQLMKVLNSNKVKYINKKELENMILNINNIAYNISEVDYKINTLIKGKEVYHNDSKN